MRDVFKSWRRKLGVVTLVLACGFMAVWIRSYSTMDTIQFRVSNKSVYFLVSNRSWLYWQCVRESYPFQMTSPKTPNGTNSLRIPFTSFHFARPAGNFDNSDVLQTETFCVLMEGQRAFFSGLSFDVSGVPYWSVVLPLTLLSACLLLARPHPRAPKTTEPAPATEA